MKQKTIKREFSFHSLWWVLACDSYFRFLISCFWGSHAGSDQSTTINKKEENDFEMKNYNSKREELEQEDQGEDERNREDNR